MPYRRHTPTTRLLSLAILMALSATAQAEETTEEERWTVLDPVEVQGEAPGYTATGSSAATRTATPLIKVAQSVQVLTRTLIEEQDLQTVSDALVNVSGVVPTRTMEAVLQPPLVRGFDVNYFFDGLPTYGLPAGVADPATLVNVERIEVVKGPAGNLYGGGSGAPLSGLLNLVSRDPEAQAGGSVALRGGSFDTIGGEFDLNLPAADGALGLRINGIYESADSYIREIDSRRQALFPTLAWHLSDDTTLAVRGQFNRLEQREYSGLPAELAIVGGPVVSRYTFAGAPDAPRTELANDMGTVQLDHRFSGRWQGSLALRRYEGEFDEYATFPLLPLAGTVYAFGSGYLPSEVEKTFFTASMTGEFDGGGASHRLLVGVDHDQTDYYGALGLDFAWGIVDYADPSTNAPFGLVPALSDVQRDDLGTTAVFVQDQIGIGDRLDLTLSLRWTELSVESLYTSFGIPFVQADETYTQYTPRAGATYAVSDTVSLFAAYGEGFQGVVAAFGVDDPQPEESRSYEAGVKIADARRGITGTVSLYRLERQNVVTPDPVNIGQSIQTGEQRSQGLEADVVYEPTDAFSLLFNYAYTDAEVTRDNVLPVGDRLYRVPEHSGRLAARYRFKGELAGLGAGIGVTAVSERELTLPNTVATGGMALVDAQLSYALGWADVSLSVQNLLGRKAFEPYQYLGGAFVIPTMPRAAFVTLRGSF